MKAEEKYNKALQKLVKYLIKRPEEDSRLIYEVAVMIFNRRKKPLPIAKS